MRIHDRLRFIRQNENLSQSRFAIKHKVPQSTYAQWELGTRAIPDDFKQKLAECGVNLHWLITGEGHPYTDEHQLTLPAECYFKPSEILASKVKSHPEIFENDLQIPIISSRVSAGPGEEWKDEDFLEGETLPLSKDIIRGHDINRLFAARVKGDSMIGAMIYDGDFVFAERGEISGDGIYIFSVDNEVLIKRLEYDVFNHKVNVISENPAYPARTVDEDRIVILGKVIGWLHRHPF